MLSAQVHLPGGAVISEAIFAPIVRSGRQSAGQPVQTGPRPRADAQRRRPVGLASLRLAIDRRE
jgi:hypothetical protein